MSQSGRSREPSGRSRTIVEGLLSISGWSRVKKVDGPKVSNWTVQKYESGRSRSMKVNGLLSISGWSESIKLDGPEV